MKKTFVLVAPLLCACLAGCNAKLDDPQKIVDKAIEAAGGEKYNHLDAEFDFRDKHYIAKRNNGAFSYERVFKDSLGTVHDYVTNEGFKREINGKPVAVPDTMATKYAASTNSVNYFALLPYGLNDAAVNKKFLGEAFINDTAYYKIQVTFSKEGAGRILRTNTSIGSTRRPFPWTILRTPLPRRTKPASGFGQRTIQGW